ncbi:Spx/MgsR family RNA polymerase-binding regulatory protein [Aliikangiella coralliicola]|uniref:Spx/MgsR family RNA polymerase-binding regulatory protein n=1 Tax=Aliikangiella coralliicola TaxID=2592383 RepID=A0A545TW82_9GAMM|nr:Spx/MgsR family RNA polymerase-binding regulatory protein [Aliikangiella coralliicola]TQV81488.1 Spx/MgsR family RNA polymerase-binding regulatory protein [Aliikangiella coralliicola]
MSNALQVYGIRNCDTVKKALKWLNENQLDTEFHDFKKESLPEAVVAEWFSQIDQKKLINRRGLTWRKLDDSQKALTEPSDLIPLIIENPTLVKRPVVFHQGVWSVGYDESDWQSRFL